jgi:mannan endo-1,4-beta-mannosidase
MKELILCAAAGIALLAPTHLMAEAGAASRADTGYVTATKTPARQEKIGISGNALLILGKTIEAPAKVRLVDDKAIPAVAKLYAYLDAVGRSDAVLYGHQNDIHHKAGPKGEGFTNSDTKDVTGSIAAVMGIDTLSLTGNELGTWNETAERRIAQAAAVTKEASAQGAIITLSCHMPNFRMIADRLKTGKKNGKDADSTATLADGSTNFSGYTPNVTSGNVMDEILPAGSFNAIYTQYLDLVAAYAKELEKDGIPVLFRPFHENTGSWFWWGSSFCDREGFRSVWMYTVEYLRDTKGVHNMLYVYGPSGNASDTEEYGRRYPGDDWVDMVGFDMYHQNPAEGDSFIDELKTELAIVSEFADAHGKLFALTETGVANTGAPVLKAKGNARLDWYNEILNAVAPTRASYFLLWANFGTTSGYYSPFVVSRDEGKLTGHETLDGFIGFYNNEKSVFADGMGPWSVLAVSVERNERWTAYMTAPVSGSQLTGACAISARTNRLPSGASVAATLKSKSGAYEKTIALSPDAEGVYSGTITADMLKAFGEKRGTIILTVDGKAVSESAIKVNVAK